MTAGDLVTAALRKAGVIATGETPSASEMSDGLSCLRLMIDSFSNEGLLLYKYSRIPLSLTPSQATYTLGTGGQLNTPRFMNLPKAKIIQTPGNVELEVNVNNIQKYADIVQKDLQSTLVTDIFIDGDYPYYNLTVWPVPSQAQTLVLYVQEALTNVVNSSDVISMPPGYESMLTYNLTVEYGAEFGVQINPLHVEKANETKASIKRQNTKPVYMKSDIQGLPNANSNSFNIYIGE